MRQKQPAERSKLARIFSCSSAHTRIQVISQLCSYQHTHQTTMPYGNERRPEMKGRYAVLMSLSAICLILFAITAEVAKPATPASSSQFLGSAEANSKQLIEQGRQIFRFDTF